MPRGAVDLSPATLASPTVHQARSIPARLSLFAARQAHVLEAALLLGLGLLALVLRLPNYQLVPAFTDEVDEAYRGLLIADGKLLPLTNVDAYNGSLWNFLVAAAFKLSDFNLFAPRILVLAIGVLTVPATYLLGRSWGGPTGGAVAALLLATSAVHIVVNSHIAWGHCITPLFTTLGVWTLYREVILPYLPAPSVLPNPPTPLPCEGRGANSPFPAREGGRAVRSSAVGGQEVSRKRRGWAVRSGLFLALSGLCWGLAFQTHPTVLAMMPGAAVFLAWKGRPLLRTRWPYLAACLFLLVNLNLLVYNLTTGFGSISSAVSVAADYTRDEALTPSVYPRRLGAFSLGLLRHLGGGENLRQDGNAAQILLDPGLWPIALLAGTGLIVQWRRSNPLPALLLAGLALAVPLFDGRFEVVTHGRYLTPMLPLFYASVGALVALGLRRAQRTRPEGLGVLPGAAFLAPVALGLVVAFLALHPLPYLRSYYQQELRFGRTNGPILQTLELIAAPLVDDAPIIVDQPPQQGSVGLGGGSISGIFRLALALKGAPYRLANLDSPDEALSPSARCRGQLVVLALRKPESKLDVVTRMHLQVVELGPAFGQPPRAPYPLYRLERLTDGGTGC